MRWFRQWLGWGKAKKNALEDISALLSALNQAVSNTDSGIQKGLRRLSLAQQKQSDAIATLSYESTSLKCAIAGRHGVVLTYEHIVHLLDHLAKINHAANNREVIAPLVARATEELLSLCELEAVAAVSTPYPAQGCEVVGAVAAPLSQPGAVHEILQQGYQTPDGQVVRVAKVVVCREANTEQDLTQSNETQDEETNHAH